MIAVVTIIDPPAPGLGKSYGALEFAKYGVCCWEYEIPTPGGGASVGKGPIHWINFPDSCFMPEYPNPIAFHYYLNANVKAHIEVLPTIRTDIADTVVAGLTVNLLRGLGVPFIP